MSKWTFAQHTEQVRLILTQAIDAKYSSRKTAIEILNDAHGFINMQRMTDQGSVFFRDADYYLWGRCLVADNPSLFGRLTMGTVLGAGALAALQFIYNPAKMGAVSVDTISLGHTQMQRRLRTDFNNPNAPPGGALFLKRGSWDGYHDNPSAMVKPLVPMHWPDWMWIAPADLPDILSP